MFKLTEYEVELYWIKDFLKRNENFRQVIFVCFDIENYLIYKELLGVTE